MSQAALCPCGSQKASDACCAPILAGAPAPTALALMRSRYTAYVVANVDYIVDTHDPATRGEVDRQATRAWAEDTSWSGLEILASENGGEADQDGVVEFIAKGATAKQPFVHHERSTFRRIDGRWFYVDGVTPKPAPKVKTTPDVGRNDPCPCGSGKKYKRCHGA